MSLIHPTKLFGGALASVLDVSCRHHASPCGGEERSTSHKVIFVRRGVFAMHLEGGRRAPVVAEPVHAMLLNDGDVFRVSHPANGGDDCTVLEFPTDAALDVVRAFDPAAGDAADGPFRIAQAPVAADGWLRLRELRGALLADGAAETMAAEEEALALLARVVHDGWRARGERRALMRGPARQRQRMVERTRELLAAAPGRAHTLATLAREVHSSPFHLTRVFRDELGVPVHQYLMRLRLTLALQRLDEGERTLSALALDLGFSSHSHLTTAFRRHFGVAPSAVDRLRRARA